MPLKSYKIKLDLNNKQKTLCSKHAGVARHAYNYFVDYCKKQFDWGNKIPSAIDMHKLLVKDVKSVNDWYYEVSKCSPQQALRNLEQAYKNFHTKQKKHNYKLFKYKTINGVKTIIGLDGLPQFKKKNVNDSFYLEGTKSWPLLIDGNKIKIPKFGWVKCCEILPVGCIIKNVTISRHADEWYISFFIDTHIDKTIKKYKSVGVDLGVKTLATLSNGQKFDNIKPYKNAKKKLRRQQKELSRRYIKDAESQSKNYIKSKTKLSKTHKKISDVRKDNIHKITSYLAKEFETVVIEDLNVKGMSKNHNLSSAILDGGFGEFKRQLMYKKEWYGGNVILANTFYASSKICNCCKHKNDDLKLKDRTWVCINCGTKHDRDDNASNNLDSLCNLIPKEYQSNNILYDIKLDNTLVNNNKTVSSTGIAFGDESPVVVNNPIQLVDELGIKHQMFIFV
jgi:putative transposase